MSLNKLLKLADYFADKVEQEIYKSAQSAVIDKINPNVKTPEVEAMQKELQQLGHLIKNFGTDEHKMHAQTLLMSQFGVDGKYGNATRAALNSANVIAKASDTPEMKFDLSKQSIVENTNNILALRRILSKAVKQKAGEGGMVALLKEKGQPQQVAGTPWGSAKDTKQMAKNEVSTGVQSLLEIGSKTKKV